MKSIKEKNKVSLIIPCYNGAAFLPQCFQCILNQSYHNIELIIVNDGSTDASEQIIQQHQRAVTERGYEFIYVKKENGGAASAVNDGLNCVTGQYLMLYDVDDILMRDAVKAKADFLDQHPEYGLARSNVYYVRSKNPGQNSYLFVTKRNEKRREHIFEDLVLGRTNNWTGTYMIRTELFFKCIRGRSIYVSPWGQNLQILLPVAYLYRAGFIDRPLMRYVDHGNSVSKTQDPQRELKLFCGFEENRIEIIRRMEMPEEEKERYIAQIRGLYLHIKLQSVCCHGNQEQMRHYHAQLKERGLLKMTDRLCYWLSRTTVTRKLYHSAGFCLKMARCMYLKAEGKVLRHDPLY